MGHACTELHRGVGGTSRQSQSALNLCLEGRGDRVRQALDFQFDPVDFDQGELNKLRQRMETRSPTSGQVESHET